MRRYDGQSEEGRRAARRATIKRIEGAPKRELPEEPGNSQPAKSPTDESLLIAWLCERVDSTIPRKDERAIARNVLRANVAALVHGRCESEPGLMTVAEVVEYAGKNPGDLDLEQLREKTCPRCFSSSYWQKGG